MKNTVSKILTAPLQMMKLLRKHKQLDITSINKQIVHEAFESDNVCTTHYKDGNSLYQMSAILSTFNNRRIVSESIIETKRRLDGLTKYFKHLPVVPNEFFIIGDHLEVNWYAKGIQIVHSKDEYYKLYMVFASYLDDLNACNFIINEGTFSDGPYLKIDFYPCKERSHTVKFNSKCFGTTGEEIEVHDTRFLNRSWYRRYSGTDMEDHNTMSNSFFNKCFDSNNKLSNNMTENELIVFEQLIQINSNPKLYSGNCIQSIHASVYSYNGQSVAELSLSEMKEILDKIVPYFERQKVKPNCLTIYSDRFLLTYSAKDLQIINSSENLYELSMESAKYLDSLEECDIVISPLTLEYVPYFKTDFKSKKAINCSVHLTPECFGADASNMTVYDARTDAHYWYDGYLDWKKSGLSLKDYSSLSQGESTGN